ncbi:MAG: capsular biosynthesis protein [Phyllobacterium sp.]
MNNEAEAEPYPPKTPATPNVHFGLFGSAAKHRRLPAKDRKRILLLQGPVGPFFKHLQSHLENQGFDAWRICFNAGDNVYSNRKNRIAYEGGTDHWSEWFSTFLKTSDIDFLIVFGCERDIHRIAIAHARAAGVHVISLEEGYIRPGFVTIENGGNNRMSPLAGYVPDELSALPAQSASPAGDFNSFRTMCLHGCTYYIARNILTNPAQRKTFHKDRALVSEAFYWVRNVYRRLAHQALNFSTLQTLLEHHDRRYFIVPLQVPDDMQLRAASHGWTNEKLVMSAISSFANHAPETHRLVFKIHPLERGHSNHREFIRQRAKVNNISHRVDVIDAGSLGLLVRHSAGMITINSTSGLSAIAHGVPLMVIGDAIYSNPRLAICAQGNPDFRSFWTATPVADAPLRKAYLHWIAEKCLVAGDFYAKDGIKLAAEAIVVKIQSINTQAQKSFGAAPLSVDASQQRLHVI